MPLGIRVTGRPGRLLMDNATLGGIVAVIIVVVVAVSYSKRKKRDE